MKPILNIKQIFIGNTFLAVRRFSQLKEILSNFVTEITGVFCNKNEANTKYASQFAWVFGDGLVQCTNVVSLVNNPSPLTHENIQWRYSRGY